MKDEGVRASEEESSRDGEQRGTSDGDDGWTADGTKHVRLVPRVYFRRTGLSMNDCVRARALRIVGLKSAPSVPRDRGRAVKRGSMAIRNDEGTTVIGRGATVRGDVISSGDIVIEGVVEGSVQAEGARLTVGRDARVKAELRAQEVVVMGSVEGNLRASERVELRAGAAVRGDVFAKRFVMEEEAVLRGRVDPTRAGEAPAEQVKTPAAERGNSVGLFSGAPVRPAGQMPTALAAAARGLSAPGTPAGLTALAVEGQASFDEGLNA